MTEADLMRAIQIRVTSLGHRVFRNNVGFAHTSTGSPLHFGLAVGSADLIGLTSKGRFLSIEVKTVKGRVTDEQLAWQAMIISLGGIAIIARSVADVDALL
jgi:hypothetical protein